LILEPHIIYGQIFYFWKSEKEKLGKNVENHCKSQVNNQCIILEAQFSVKNDLGILFDDLNV
jgi:hypothetical protein